MKKPGRNDPCPCGSGKKFKKCCESKMLGGRFQATKVEAPEKKASGLTSLFQNVTTTIPKKTTASDPVPPLKKKEEEEKPPEKPEDPQP